MTGRKILSRVLMLIGGLGFGLVAAEVLIRLAAPMPTLAESAQFYMPNPLYGWTHIPNRRGYWAGMVQPGIESLRKEFKTAVQINSHGLRDREIPYEKPRGTTRILLLGDSMTEGMQVPLKKTFAKRVETILNTAGERVEVINSGTAGYGTDNELLFYRHEGKKYRPDVVLLAYFLNDVLDNFPPLWSGDRPVPKPYFTLTPTGLVLENFPLPVTATDPAQTNRHNWLEPLKEFLHKHSELYTFGAMTLVRHPLVMRVLSLIGLAKEESVDHAKAVVSAQTGIPIYYLVYQVPEDPRLTQARAVTRALIRTLRREVEAEGSRFGVIILTGPEQVHPDLWRLAQQRFPSLRSGEWDLERPNRLLRVFLEQEGIPFVNLLPPLRARAAAGGEALHFANDGHYTVAGHAAAAEAIATFLKDGDLLSGKIRPGGARRARP